MVTIRAYREEDAEAAWRLRRLSFGGPRETSVPDLPGAWNGLVAESDGAVAGFLRIWRYNQFFGGAAVPMGGVASVAVHPHARGQGVAGRLLTEALRVMRASGQHVSTLYPYVIPVYRNHGWEHTGTRLYANLSLAALSAVPRVDVPLRPATPEDVEGMRESYLRVAPGINGMLDRAAPAFDPALVLDHDVVTVAPHGHLVADRPDGKRLMVRDLVAEDLATMSALLRQLASWAGGMTEAEVRVLDGTLLDLVAPGGVTLSRDPFMFRVVDLPAAVAARGWSVDGRFEVDIEVTDDQAPWNAGRWRLVADDGVVTCEPGGTGAVRLASRALGPWYAGSATAATLRRAGLLEGDREIAERLDRLTGAPHPVHMVEAF
ncbi:GNAT family N-acetyltransferase [Actinokineospora auranticolor]|uniref:Putative acetyltransferase n=1 Tax=Actinokineospora auranticolor TaxID=155976 RepID=A0A2S6GZ04_9PSEU|nr:GNAT family N-acetyltransferase [Actinokineospora auranticolor]PPK70396.1 putative acetyltransferase [Actinokineospora auranticolor]